MKQVSEATAAALRHRQFHWCRRQNGFSDMPVWRLVATMLNMPVYQVLAVVNRLEELANAAPQRGFVGHFNPAEFGAALGMSAEDAARIFAALEAPEIGWVAYDHVATFYDRNPDKEDNTAADRKRRQRERERTMKDLARQAASGEITEEERQAREIALLIHGRLSQRDSVTPGRAGDNFQYLNDLRLGLSTAGHDVTPRDIVTVTPEKTISFSSRAVDNFGDSDRCTSAGSAEEGFDEIADAALAATVWVDVTGKKLLVDTLQIRFGLAETYIDRWRRDLDGDDVTLATIMRASEGAGYIGARFHTLVTDQIKRHAALKQRGPQLPLMPPRPQRRDVG